MPNKPHPPLVELWDEVHAAFDRVFERHPNALACRSGCARCCVAGISVNQVEADAITGWLAELPAAERAQIAELAARREDESCLLLNADKSCSIYPVRPVICRVYGIPVRKFHAPWSKPSRRHLPIFGVFAERADVVSTCEKNFIETRVQAVRSDCIVDDRATRLRRKAAAAGFTPRDGTEALPHAQRSPLAALVRATFGGAP